MKLKKCKKSVRLPIITHDVAKGWSNSPCEVGIGFPFNIRHGAWK